MNNYDEMLLAMINEDTIDIILEALIEYLASLQAS